MSKRKRLFYDIETSFCQGHFWRPGWNQTIHPHQITEHSKIISIHWSWEGEDEVHNLHWGLSKQCDKAMLKKFIKVLDSASEVITHNGKKFDTPWLRTRAMYHGLEFKHSHNEVDTYKLAKKYLNLPSYSLKNICDYYGLEAKKDAGGIQTWIDVIYKKDKKALDHLLYYGDGDILSLKAVYYKFRPYVDSNTHYHIDLVDVGDKLVSSKFFCPECGGLLKWNKQYVTKAGTIQHYMKCRDKQCATYHKISNRDYMNYLKYTMKNNIK